MGLLRRSSLLVAAGLLALASALTGVARGGPDGPPAITIDRDDVDVTGSVRVEPGVYRVADARGDGVLRVVGDGVTVDLTGVTLVGCAEGASPEGYEGIGIAVKGGRGVTIRGGTVRGFRVGIRAEGSPGIRVEGADVSEGRRMRLRSTPEREDEADWLWPHENDAGQWETRYGAGISLTNCPEARVARCVGHRGQNGLLLSRCDGAEVEGNDFSFNSGWGVALWRTCDAKVLANRCDWCVRGYSHGVYARGQDSAGFLVFEQCSRNLFRGNSATHSGDGFFLYAGNETLKTTGRGGCDDNEVVSNDFSQAVANGIEATFSRGNRFLHNRLDECDHGVWAGYSYDSVVQGNSIAGCANGVSVEHGHANRIVGNALKDCGVGVHLWWDDDKDLLASVYGRTQETASARNRIERNAVLGGTTGVRLVGDVGSSVEGNVIEGARTCLEVGRGTKGLRVAGNRIAAATPGREVRSEAEEAVAAAGNAWGEGGPRVEGSVTTGDALPAVQAGPPPEDAPGPLPGSTGAFLAPDAPRGRRFILVDDGGPIDPREPAVFPATQTASGPAAVHVLGAGVPFQVTSISEGFLAQPREGTAPATVRIRPAAGAALPSLAPFEATVRVGARSVRVSGQVLVATWTVRFYRCRTDPRKDAAAWAALVAGPPLDTLHTDSLAFAWPGAPTPKVPADGFGTVAETTLDLPAGRYRLRITSDDGVRVLVDGAKVLEDWTWHGPKEDAVEVTLSAGPHAVRVEHFELDGYAALRCAVEPVSDRR